METDDRTAEVKTEDTPYGKMIGVVTDHEQLQAVSTVLSAFGVEDVEVFAGLEGMQQLEKWKEDVAQTFMGDMDSETVQRCRTAVESGRIVFAALLDSASAEPAAESLKRAGASGVVYFGTWVITNF